MGELESIIERSNMIMCISLVKEISRQSFILTTNIERFDKNYILEVISRCKKEAENLPTENPDIRIGTIKTKGKTYREILKKIAEYINITADELYEKIDSLSNDDFYNYKHEMLASISEMELASEQI